MTDLDKNTTQPVSEEGINTLVALAEAEGDKAAEEIKAALASLDFSTESLNRAPFDARRTTIANAL